MKKKYGFVIILLVVMCVCAAGIAALTTDRSEKEDGKINIVTSFYPVYIAALNITDGIDSVVLDNLTEPSTGCLHDYQLTTADLVSLESADMLIINGAGMESFLDDVTSNYEDLQIVDAGESIDIVEASEEHAEHEHEHEHEDGEEEVNGHFWMNTTKYVMQIENITAALMEADPDNSQAYRANADKYIEKVSELTVQIEELSAQIEAQDIVIFHTSFAYMAEELGLSVAYEIEMEEDTSLSAGDIAEIVDIIDEHGIKALFTEEQYSTSIADSVAKESGAVVYVLDSLVTGEYDKDAYIEGMQNNIDMIKEVFLGE